MPGILITVFNMSIAGSVVIILALITRFFLRAVSKKYSYILWGIVCLRLLCPFGLHFPSVLRLFQRNNNGNLISRTEYIHLMSADYAQNRIVPLISIVLRLCSATENT